MTKYISVADADGDLVQIPAKFVICGRCEGEGKCEHSAFSNGVTSSEWNEMDSEQQETYMSGGYDVICPDCAGERVVLVADEDVMTDEQKALVEANEKLEREFAAECEMERRMGC